MAATVIDSLVVELILGVSRFLSGQRQAQQAMTQTRQQAQAHAKAVEADVQRAHNTIGSLKAQALALLAIFLGGRGIKEFAEHITQTDAALGRFSRAFGLNVRDVSVWQRAVELAGGNAEEVTSSLQKYSDSLQAFRAGVGDPTWVARINQLQKEGGHAINLLAPVTEQFVAIGENLQEVARKSGTVKANWFARMLGLDPGVVNLMLSNMKEHLRHAKEIGSATRQDADAAERRLNAWRGMVAEGERFGELIMTTLTPAIENLARKTEEFFRPITHALELGLNPPRPVSTRRREYVAQHPEDADRTVAPGEGPPGFIPIVGLTRPLPRRRERVRIEGELPPQGPSLFGVFGPAGLGPRGEIGGQGFNFRGIPSAAPADLYNQLTTPGGQAAPGKQTSIHSETHIAQLTINTQATDADRIARDIGPAIERARRGIAVNTGLA